MALQVNGLASAPAASRTDLRAVKEAVVDVEFMSCRLIWSPATMAKAAAIDAHTVGVGLSGASATVRQLQWAAWWKCYSVSGIGAHLEHTV